MSRLYSYLKFSFKFYSSTSFLKYWLLFVVLAYFCTFFYLFFYLICFSITWKWAFSSSFKRFFHLIFVRIVFLIGKLSNLFILKGRGFGTFAKRAFSCCLFVRLFRLEMKEIYIIFAHFVLFFLLILLRGQKLKGFILFEFWQHRILGSKNFWGQGWYYRF